MRLQSKVLLVSLALTALFCGVVAAVGRRATEAVMIRELGARHRRSTEILARQLSPSVDRRKIDAMGKELVAAAAVTGARAIEVLDEAGQVLQSTDRSELGQLRHSAASKASIASSLTIAQRQLNRRQGDVLVMSTPVWSKRVPDRRLGTLRLVLPLEETLRSAARVGRIVAAMAAAFCLLALGLTLALLRAVLRPVLDIAEATARVSSGDYQVSVSVRSDDELGALARAFNDMSGALSRTVVSRDKLEEALSIARATLDASADAVLVVGTDRRIVTYNSRFLEVYGFTEELVKSSMADNVILLEHTKNQVEDPEAFVRNSTNGYEDFSVGERRDLLRFKDGRVFERISRPYRIGDEIVGRTITFRDLTLHLEGVRALAQARDEAVEAARLRSQFLANVSHELRTPLNAVIGSAGLLTGTRLDADQREHAETLASAARTLLDLAEDVLDFSKLEAGRMTVERAALRPSAVLKDAAALVRPRALEKGLRFMVEGGGADERREVLGDARRLRQVLMNLLTNAVKFTPSGDVEASVRAVSVGPSSVELEFSVHDTGVGIPADQKPRLFQPFSQGGVPKESGAGLGLAISKSLVELMGGTIGFASEPGRGSHFWVRLAMDLARPDGPKPKDAVRTAETPRGPRARLRVLVAEDNAINRRLLTQQLERLGCTVVAAEDGRAALEALGAGDFGLVLMDCRMPSMDGYAAAAEIRRREGGRRRIPIIAITANAGEEDRRRCLDAGMDDFLPKPVAMGALADALDRWDLPFDHAALSTFTATAASSPQEARRLLEEFLEDVGARLAEIRGADGRLDSQARQRAAHTLKGSAATVGARGLRELAARIEQALGAGAPCDSLLAQAEAEWQRLREAAGRAGGGA